MTEESIPPQLAEARDKIDAIDRQLVLLLAERFNLTGQVGQLKAENNLNAVDPGRETEKLAVISELCMQHGLNPELVSNIFSQIMAEVVLNHRRIQNAH